MRFGDVVVIVSMTLAEILNLRGKCSRDPFMDMTNFAHRELPVHLSLKPIRHCIYQYSRETALFKSHFVRCVLDKITDE